MLNRDGKYEYQPPRDRPLQRKIAQHRERDLATRSQYSEYDKLNDERSAYAWTGPEAGRGFFGMGGGWCSLSWEYWVARVGIAAVMSVIFLITRGCDGGAAS